MATVKSGTKVTFSGKGESFEMSIRFRICQVIVDGASHVVFNVSGGTAKDLSFHIVNSYYFPSYIWGLTFLFQKWRLNRARVEYEPRCNTSATSSFVIASPKDIEWIEQVGGTSGGVADGSEYALTSLDNACTVVGYGRCNVDLRMMKTDGWLFTNCDQDPTTLIDYNATSSASLRQAIGAQLLIAGSPGNVGNNELLGDLYCQMTISLSDMSLGSVQATLLDGMYKNILHHRKLKSKDEGKYRQGTFRSTTNSKPNTSTLGDIEDCPGEFIQVRSSSRDPVRSSGKKVG